MLFVGVVLFVYCFDGRTLFALTEFFSTFYIAIFNIIYFFAISISVLINVNIFRKYDIIKPISH